MGPPSGGTGGALHKLTFHNRDGFKHQVPSVLKERPQGRCFLVEMATNHRHRNRSGVAVATVNVTDERKPCHPQEQAALREPVIML